MAKFLDFDSDGDADVLIASLTDPDRLHSNDGSGKLKLLNPVEPILGNTFGTLDIALADLNKDCRLDVVQAQGESSSHVREKVHLGRKIPPDTSPPVITNVEKVSALGTGEPIRVRARVHDNKSPTMPHDWRKVVVRWSTDGRRHEKPMQWYGEYLWSAKIGNPPAGEFSATRCVPRMLRETMPALRPRKWNISPDRPKRGHALWDGVRRGGSGSLEQLFPTLRRAAPMPSKGVAALYARPSTTATFPRYEAWTRLQSAISTYELSSKE